VVNVADQRLDYERQFRRAGLPMFVEGFSASTDVFNRAAPLLGLVFLGELLGAGQLDWTWWQNVLAVTGGVVLVLVAMAVLNVIQGRPARAIPNRLGKTELAAFVIVPALLPLIFGGQIGSAVSTVAANLLILFLIYAVFVYGLLAIVRWVLARFAGQIRSSLGLLAKAVPLLAIFALLSFASQEMWQIFATLSNFA
jgi:small neutral amino acid transporter SnatA (MarC family)